MSSDEDNLSDEDVLDDEWPDDYFGIDVNEYEPKIKQPDFSLKMITHLPMDLLRKIVEPFGLRDRYRLWRTNHLLREAVETSRWECSEKLVVSAAEKESILYVQVSFGPDIRVRRLDAESAQVFPRLHRLFTTMHLKELRLNNVPLEHELLKELNQFIDDGCTFDRLSIMKKSSDSISQRTRDLMRRATIQAVIEMDTLNMTIDEMLSFDHPVTYELPLNEDRLPRIPVLPVPPGPAPPGGPVAPGPALPGGPVLPALLPLFPPRAPVQASNLTEEQFVEMVRRGHSLLNFRVDLTTAGALSKIVEAISSSVHQKIDVKLNDLAVCDIYLESIKEDTEVSYGGPFKIETCTHLGATIKVYRPMNQGLGLFHRIVVKSENYQEEENISHRKYK